VPDTRQLPVARELGMTSHRARCVLDGPATYKSVAAMRIV
jgi:hypothetical protein